MSFSNVSPNLNQARNPTPQELQGFWEPAENLAPPVWPKVGSKHNHPMINLNQQSLSQPNLNQPDLNQPNLSQSHQLNQSRNNLNQNNQLLANMMTLMGQMSQMMMNTNSPQ